MNIWHLSEYATDIIKSLIGKEAKRTKFYFRSPQSKERPMLISWIRQISEELKLRNSTLHLAVYVLDVFMDNHEIAIPQLKLFAIVCLLLAAKFEELDSNIPKISTLKCKVDGSYLATEFITMEIVILKFVDWDLAHPTVPHFLEYFSNFVVLTTECCSQKHESCKTKESIRCNNFKQLKMDANELIQDFMDVSFQDITYMSFQPSVIASAIIFSVRHLLSLKPKWTSTLAKATGLNSSDILTCSSWLLRELDNDTGRSSSNLDQGYFTKSSSGSPILYTNHLRVSDNCLETPAQKHGTSLKHGTALKHGS